MALPYATTVNALYLAYFGRPADPGGLRHWTDYLSASGGNTAHVIASFDASLEAQNRFGQQTAEARITAIYQQLLDRAPEPAGLAFWTGMMQSGQVSMADAAFAIVNAVQGSDATLVAVRSKAASAFTNAIETTGTGYAGEGGADVGRALIASISAGSSDADITRAVDAAATLSDIVSTQPGVLSALIGSGSLLDLFSTTRGGTDAVTLLEVLGRLGELAQSDPSGLQAILRGGDITQMLSALPSTTSLQQLLEALNSGGFSGGAAVIYPPPLSPPSAPLNVTITFESVMSHADDTEPNDAVTRICVAYVQFDVAGTVPAGHKFEYSIDN